MELIGELGAIPQTATRGLPCFYSHPMMPPAMVGTVWKDGGGMVSMMTVTRW